MVIARGAILHCSTVAAPDCKEGRFTITCKLRLVCPVSPGRACGDEADEMAFWLRKNQPGLECLRLR